MFESLFKRLPRRNYAFSLSYRYDYLPPPLFCSPDACLQYRLHPQHIVAARAEPRSRVPGGLSIVLRRIAADVRSLLHQSPFVDRLWSSSGRLFSILNAFGHIRVSRSEFAAELFLAQSVRHRRQLCETEENGYCMRK